MIELRRVDVRVPVPRAGAPAAEKTLLSDISLTLAERRIAVIGPNGSGKSTLLRLVNGLVRPSSGTVMVNGLDVAKRSTEVRRTVGFVFTDPSAQLVMATPLDDIELSLRTTIADRVERRARAMEVLDVHGLGPVAQQSIYALSGGERQLVALCSVLAVNPTILVADEPTTLLDLPNRQKVRTLLTALTQQCLYATHDLELAEDADRVLLVDGGRIAADGAPDEVIAHYRRMWA